MEDESLPYILAVDDDFAVRMAMDFMFKKWPEYNLILAEDPNDALVKLEERDYMMMFSDINMPVMSGLDLLKIVKERKPDLPVIMLTSETDIQNSITAFRYGAMDYLLKPPTVATVRGAIDKAVEFLEEEVVLALTASSIKSLTAVNIPPRISTSVCSTFLAERLARTIPDFDNKKRLCTLPILPG